MPFPVIAHMDGIVLLRQYNGSRCKHSNEAEIGIAPFVSRDGCEFGGSRFVTRSL